MSTDLIARSTATVHAPIEKVWQAITTPAIIKQWFLGVDTKTDWKQGSSIVHTGEWKGKPYTDRGTIVEIEPPHRLVHTHWSDMSGLPDRPESYQTVTYELTERDGATEIEIFEENLPNEQARSMSEKTWPTVLEALRKLLERG
jgi:uncharacterized protein YndB with AHSA1/START domain